MKRTTLLRLLGLAVVGVSAAVAVLGARPSPPSPSPTAASVVAPRAYPTSAIPAIAVQPPGPPSPGAVASARALVDAPDLDPRVRMHAALVLGASGEDSAVAPLCRVLNGDFDTSTRGAAASALGKLGKQSAIPCLRAAFAKEREEDVKKRIDRALAVVVDVDATTLAEQREALFRRMAVELHLSDTALAEVRRIFEASSTLGQGNPIASIHPMTRAQCREVRAAAGLRPSAGGVCGAKHMAPLYDPSAGQSESSATVCIDQFEFPGIPCEYPVVYARANEAAELCSAVGKRICDAHEWEGACAGAVRKPEVEYAWGNERPLATYYHNQEREILWAYGPARDDSKCALSGAKSPKCVDGGWKRCGSNTWPAGSFPGCVSALGVYDLNGNAAEHMNLPMSPEELASRGGSGSTEMKGSWFATGGLDLEGDCRWRAKDWHPSKLTDPESHRNYHLGFRCCKDRAP